MAMASSDSASEAATSHLSPSRTPRNSPNKRPKTLTPTSPPSPPPSDLESRLDGDGSSPPADSEPQRCGICLCSEDGSKANVIRGRIDSCDHFFCFVCIMEWAKVESRCPLCKRRFTAIRRPPRIGLFPAERVVNVPLRDQVYHYSGNATVGSSDPYSEVRCTVCDSEGDENFLLLCDLCDSASHTYCVGLGATVPEGDWFCKDCTVLKVEHEKCETDMHCGSQMNFRSFDERTLVEEHPSILAIRRESRFREVERPSTRASAHVNHISTPVLSERRTNQADSMTELRSETIPSVAPTAATATELGARTLRRCRNMHGRIQELRENWNAFRSGSLSFRPRSAGPTGDTHRIPSTGAIFHDRSGQPHSTSCSSQHEAAQMGSSCDKIPDRGSYDVVKAWKMLDVAKSMERAHERTNIVSKASKHPLRKLNTTIGKANTSSSLLASSSKPFGTKDLAKTGPQNHNQFYSPVKGHDRHKSPLDVRQNQGSYTAKRILISSESSHSAQSPGHCELPSSREVQTSGLFRVCHVNGVRLTEESSCTVSSDVLSKHDVVSSDVLSKHDVSGCFISPAGPVTPGSNTTSAKLEVSSSNVGLPNAAVRIEKSRAGSKSRRDDYAKSEIQSLVKLNLKLLTRDRRLGVDAFKEIARLATHSILAACGLECPKPGVQSFACSVCCHTNHVQAQQRRMSTLMPSSCRECFYVFVKDVVNTVVVEKTGRT